MARIIGKVSSAIIHCIANDREPSIFMTMSFCNSIILNNDVYALLSRKGSLFDSRGPFFFRGETKFLQLVQEALLNLRKVWDFKTRPGREKRGPDDLIFPTRHPGLGRLRLPVREHPDPLLKCQEHVSELV